MCIKLLNLHFLSFTAISVIRLSFVSTESPTQWLVHVSLYLCILALTPSSVMLLPACADRPDASRVTGLLLYYGLVRLPASIRISFLFGCAILTIPSYCLTPRTPRHGRRECVLTVASGRFLLSLVYGAYRVSQVPVSSMQHHATASDPERAIYLSPKRNKSCGLPANENCRPL